MLYLISGLLVFFAVHFIASFRTRATGNIRDKMGYGAYMGLFSLASFVGLGLIVWGYGQARLEPSNMTLWTAPEWARHILLVGMLPSLIILVAAYAPTGYIKKLVKHPMVLAVKLWAFMHLIYNGDLASLLLFGAFLGFGVVSRIRAAKRGDNGPVNVSPNAMGDVIAIVAGAGLYAFLAYEGHEWLTGVPVLS